MSRNVDNSILPKHVAKPVGLSELRLRYLACIQRPCETKETKNLLSLSDPIAGTRSPRVFIRVICVEMSSTATSDSDGEFWLFGYG